MIRFEKYCKNLGRQGNSIFSYATCVAQIVDEYLVWDKYYSVTTTKHINYAGICLDLKVIPRWVYENKDKNKYKMLFLMIGSENLHDRALGWFYLKDRKLKDRQLKNNWQLIKKYYK